MGHANLANLSQFFINRLYAKGAVSIRGMAEAAARAGQTVQASEGEYDDDGMLCMAFMQIVHYLTLEDPSAHHYSGPRGGGPWIEPVLDAKHFQPKGASRTLRLMIAEYDKTRFAPRQIGPQMTCGVLADRFIDEGAEDVAEYVRSLPQKIHAFQAWADDRDDNWGWEEGTPGWHFEHTLWRFAPGWRKRYREVPGLGNVTN